MIAPHAGRPSAPPYRATGLVRGVSTGVNPYPFSLHFLALKAVETLNALSGSLARPAGAPFAVGLVGFERHRGTGDRQGGY